MTRPPLHPTAPGRSEPLSLAPSAATIHYRDDGTPYSPLYDDIYHSASGSLGQARHVYIAASGLPARWAGRRLYAIVETGFGAGLNFLAVWRAWQSDPAACERLHFVSFEKHPLSLSDLQQLFAHYLAEIAAQPSGRDDAAALTEMTEALLAAWPRTITAGLHRMAFADGRVILTVGFGDATTLVKNARLRANALFLDGFSPSRNPQMWDIQLFKALARIADEGATVATYTTVGEVRRNLIEAGFAMRRAPGYGSKREMLVGEFAPRWRVRRHAPPQQRQTGAREAIVIGAGLAGCAVVERLAARGWHITLIDQAEVAAGAASGNPAGVFHPMITRDEGLAARLSRAGFVYGLRYWQKLQAAGLPIRWSANGLLQKYGNTADDEDNAIGPTVTAAMAEAGAAADTAAAAGAETPAEKQPKTPPSARPDASGSPAQAPGLPAAIARRLTAAEVDAQAGVPVGSESWLFAEGGWIDPVSLCNAQLTAAGSRLTRRFGCRVERLERDGEHWRALDASGHCVGSAPIVILANAHDAARLACLSHAPTESIRGQLTILPPSLFPSLKMPVIGGGYLTPTPDGALTGASYGIGDTRTEIDASEHADNLRRLAALLSTEPTLQEHAVEEDKASVIRTPLDLDVSGLGGRVAFRCVTRDRMPMIGQLADESLARQRASSLTGAQPLDVPRTDGLYGAFGFGSRGLTWSAIGAELLASLIEGEPPPLETDLIDAVDPTRFLLRDLRRGNVR